MEVEMEICVNCKKEIPHTNYVMHTAHCARNITLCTICKEPIPRGQIDAHKKKCEEKVKKKEEAARKAALPPPPPTRIEQSKYFQTKNTVEKVESKEAVKKTLGTVEKQMTKEVEKQLNKESKNLNVRSSTTVSNVKSEVYRGENLQSNGGAIPKPKPASMLSCKYCDLELPKLDLEEHENYCGSRTDKCIECGELVMFKYKKLHEDSNHGFVKLSDEPGPKASWDSNTERTATSNSEETYSSRRNRLPTLRPYSTTFDISQYTTFSPQSLGIDMTPVKKEKQESYKDLSRRLDCKTEYIRNLLHDSASITIPLRSTGTGPRNHFNHNKGPAPQPPSRRRNPPTELVIPCEFCNLPIPHEDLIEHETGCRPDLARFNPRRRLLPDEDDYSMPFEPMSSSGYNLTSNTGYNANAGNSEFGSSNSEYNTSGYNKSNPGNKSGYTSSNSGYTNTNSGYTNTNSGYTNTNAGYTSTNSVSNTDSSRYSPTPDYLPQPTGYLPSTSEVPYSPSNTNYDDEELPCEFCSEMLPASQLWRHQMTCNC